MKKTGFVYDDRYLKHDTGPGHPECSQRLEAIYKGIKESGLLDYLIPVKALPANQRWIENIHNIKYILRFEEACMMGLTELDTADNQMCRDTYDIALLSAGGVLEAVKMMMEGQIDNAFCAIRPPGHHAEHNQGMGFCFFNNIAIAARYLQEEWKIKRIGIVDFDVHHGNGTQLAFESDPSVFFYSIHEHPSFAFPGSGRDFEQGVGQGYGYTLNTTILPGQGDEEYKERLTSNLFPAFEAFQPEVILVSTGFDAHKEDDMSGVNLSSACFSWIIEQIVKMAEKYSQGRLISILEGGYCLSVLPQLAKDHVEILLGK